MFTHVHLGRGDAVTHLPRCPTYNTAAPARHSTATLVDSGHRQALVGCVTPELSSESDRGGNNLIMLYLHEKIRFLLLVSGIGMPVAYPNFCCTVDFTRCDEQPHPNHIPNYLGLVSNRLFLGTSRQYLIKLGRFVYSRICFSEYSSTHRDHVSCKKLENFRYLHLNIYSIECVKACGFYVTRGMVSLVMVHLTYFAPSGIFKALQRNPKDVTVFPY